MNNDDWHKKLTREQYHILREKGTERPFCSPLWDEKRVGIYRCAGCQAELFSSNAKFESSTGWPSFTDALDKECLRFEEDCTLEDKRKEVLCVKCGGHLGHVFTDGPEPTGLRYCINSHALTFTPEE